MDDREDGRCKARPSSIIPHPSYHVCPLSAGENREKSFEIPIDQADGAINEEKNFLDAKAINLV